MSLYDDPVHIVINMLFFAFFIVQIELIINNKRHSLYKHLKSLDSE